MVSIFSFLSCAGGSTGSCCACVSFVAVFAAVWWTGILVDRGRPHLPAPVRSKGVPTRGFLRPECYAPSRALMGPRAKYTRKPAVTTHISGCTFRIFPEQALMTAQEMKPTPMPFAME